MKIGRISKDRIGKVEDMVVGENERKWGDKLVCWY